MSAKDPRCEKCDRFLNVEIEGTIVARIRCSNSKCKHWNVVHVCNSDSSPADINHVFKPQEATV